MRKHNPTLLESGDWLDIKKFYEELDILPMIDLIDHIIDRDLSGRLYATTSTYYLIISVYEKIEIQREMLKIEYRSTDEKWNFKYFAVPNQGVEFEQEYDKSLGIDRFDQFIEFIKW